MNRLTIRALSTGLAIALALNSAAAWAVVLGSGSTGNTTAGSLTSAGGPGNPAQPGFSNVGIGPTGSTSVTYLGNGWGITAAHVTMKPGFDTVKFGSNTYTVDLNSIQVLTNPDNSLADLKLFKITGQAPNLPNITSSLINNTAPSGRTIMVGNGGSTATAKFWSVDKTNPNNWIWNEVSPPANPGPNDYAGYTLNPTNVIRWGENNVSATNVLAETFVDSSNNHYFVNGFVTTLSNLAYTGVSPLASEAQASTGDSGGAAFTLVGGQWKLSGIMTAAGRFDMLNNRPAGVVLYNDITLIADISTYRNQIIAIVPEPGSIVLGLSAMAGLAVVAIRRRKKRVG